MATKKVPKKIQIKAPKCTKGYDGKSLSDFTKYELIELIIKLDKYRNIRITNVNN